MPHLEHEQRCQVARARNAFFSRWSQEHLEEVHERLHFFRYILPALERIQDARAAGSQPPQLSEAQVGGDGPYKTLLANDSMNRMKIMQQPDPVNKDARPSA